MWNFVQGLRGKWLIPLQWLKAKVVVLTKQNLTTTVPHVVLWSLANDTNFYLSFPIVKWWLIIGLTSQGGCEE